MQSFVLILVVFIGLYLTWKLTKALVSVFVCLVLMALGAYFILPYVLDEQGTSILDGVGAEGKAILERNLDKAKSLAEDEIVKPLKSKLEPALELEKELKSLKKNHQRGVERRDEIRQRKP